MKPWLHIIGVGDEGLEHLSPELLSVIQSAELIIGGDRHLSMIPATISAKTMSWPSPLMKLVEDVIGMAGKQVVILATGDPMHFGIGVTFAKRLKPEDYKIYTSPSAFSLAAARLGWDLSQVTKLTLHGRPLELIIPHLFEGAKILALSDNGETPSKLAKLLVDLGYASSSLCVLEHMGGVSENQITLPAKDWIGKNAADLNTIAITCEKSLKELTHSTAPGLNDEAFSHDGQLTKKEIRSITLSALNPIPGLLLWDVGAGSGSIGIEWMRQNPLNRAIAVEHNESRLLHIEKNRRTLGVPALQIVKGMAPQALDGLKHPDRIFIGGGLSLEGLFEACWSSLKSGGILVANTVTIEGEKIAFDLFDKYDGELSRLNVSRANKIGGFTSWKPYRQVTQLRLIKK
ncbi:precorrin-6y C5,15-methyltransferase (decarboxylating) subunit CbiE [Sneathiella glossodoripedis]|uniref:precorrin-6y C5,15-methyltransferase (decarboxylating) subunit CbiE n=1 Tax=Sneathiella glossodoripedis TaxID=418853 RepID=UPI00046EE495|nr:precorrin-6y C5,15-methyltransferase (decarboxylating) subunit CbiE [Sneathiella glossodoripedis]